MLALLEARHLDCARVSRGFRRPCGAVLAVPLPLRRLWGPPSEGLPVWPHFSRELQGATCACLPGGPAR
jgi:hypothetical protein